MPCHRRLLWRQLLWICLVPADHPPPSLVLSHACRGHHVLTVVPRYAPYEGVEPTGIIVPLDLPAPAQASPADQPMEAGEGDEEAVAAACAAAALADAAATAAAGTVPLSTPLQPALAAAARAAAAAAGDGGGGDTAELSSGGEEEEEGGEEGRLAQHAELYQCRQGGVQRVFVDHPLFRSTGGWVGALSACHPAVALEQHWHFALHLSSLQLPLLSSASMQLA